MNIEAALDLISLLMSRSKPSDNRQTQATEPEEAGSKTFTMVRGKGKGRLSNATPLVGGKGNSCLFIPSNTEQMLWIERKLFSASSLIPGRFVRIIEMLVDRRFTVDFKTNEVTWLIGVLREASKAKFGAVFSKKASIGGRSLICSSVSNRAGVYLKLFCSYGGKNRRTLHIPSGEKGVGWGRLANLLAIISAGKNSHLKSSFVQAPVLRPKEAAALSSASLVRSSNSFADVVKGKKSMKNREIINEAWKEGSLGELIKFGLNSRLGDPSSSHEVDRRFSWKATETKIGFGLVVVESSPCGGRPKMKTISDRSKVCSSAGFTGVDGLKKKKGF